MISTFFFPRLEGPHDQLSRLFGLLPMNGGNDTSIGFLMHNHSPCHPRLKSQGVYTG